jgi:biopolymer transport protein ExbB
LVLAAAGTPDQAALAAGISEALINTATGIGTSAKLSLITLLKIDDLTYSIDEAAVSIVNTTEDSEEEAIIYVGIYIK